MIDQIMFSKWIPGRMVRREAQGFHYFKLQKNIRKKKFKQFLGKIMNHKLLNVNVQNHFPRKQRLHKKNGKNKSYQKSHKWMIGKIKSAKPLYSIPKKKREYEILQTVDIQLILDKKTPTIPRLNRERPSICIGYTIKQANRIRKGKLHIVRTVKILKAKKMNSVINYSDIRSSTMRLLPGPVRDGEMKLLVSDVEKNNT